jgi:hypothetical protein
MIPPPQKCVGPTDSDFRLTHGRTGGGAGDSKNAQSQWSDYHFVEKKKYLKQIHM